MSRLFLFIDMSTVIAVTGGIACGKSYCLDQTVKRLSILEQESRVFSCDDAVSNLLTEEDIVGRLMERAGDQILEEGGAIDRSKLRMLIFEDSKIRKKVEEVLHPAVFDLAVSFIKEFEGNSFSLIEVPLLYEVDFPIPRNFDLVIGCSEKTQLKRLQATRGIPHEQALQILKSQLPIQQKVDQSQFVIWNDGSRESFDDQLHRFLDFILSNTSGS